MRKFHNFLVIFLALIAILNLFFLIHAINETIKKTTQLEMVQYVGIDGGSRLNTYCGVVEFTTIPETTTQAKEIKEIKFPSQKEKSMTSAPTEQETTTQATKKSSPQYDEDENGRYYWFNASCTAYCGCGKCCGKYAANRNWDENGEQIILTASGNRAVPQYTIAMSKNFKFGTKVYIEGIGMCEVMDRGGAVTGNVIDIYFGSHEEALNWGRRSIKVKIYV